MVPPFGESAIDSVLTSLSPNGGTIQCGHNANCEFGALYAGGTIGPGNTMRAPQACSVPSIFTRQNPGDGGGNSLGIGGGDAPSGGNLPDMGGSIVVVVCT